MSGKNHTLEDEQLDNVTGGYIVKQQDQKYMVIDDHSGAVLIRNFSTINKAHSYAKRHGQSTDVISNQQREIIKKKYNEELNGGNS